ncbi:Histidine kinase [Anaerobium acetethylicum]|uniref:Histidine kinase n=2 Tax=Anaerobium acetethylicum TaxID=1619234 RepID=A0A1D3TZD5_9FIRM|nr:Histidine kinase [Anaerobium acetethylicum]
MKKYTINIHKKGIRAHLLVYIGFFVVLPLCLGLIILNFYLQKSMNETQKTYDVSTLSQIKNTMDQILETTNYTTSMLMTNKDMLTDLRTLQSWNEDYGVYTAKRSISAKLSELESSTLNAVGVKIAILTSEGDLIGPHIQSKTEVDYHQKSWYQEIIKNNRKTTFCKDLSIFFHEMDIYNVKVNQDLYIGRAITDYNDNYLGIILQQVSGEKIWGKFVKTLENGNEGAFYFFNNEKELQMAYNGGDEKEIQFLIKESEEWKLSQTADVQMIKEYKNYCIPVLLKHSDNMIVYTIPEKAFQLEGKGILRVILVLIFMLILLSIATMVYISGKISKPLVYVVNEVENAVNGIIKIQEPKEISFLEIQKLISSYNRAGDRIKALIEHVKLESKQKEKAHYEILMSQISPHFIFNTVNSIKIMANEKQDWQTVSALESLGKILHAVYSYKNGMTTVGQESALLQAYVDIMKMRFGDSFHYFNSIPTELYYYEIPAFTMQPIVENAILHGIHGVTAGQIIVSTLEYPNDFVISVFNNGNSADKEKMEELLKHSEQNRSNFTGIGLNNVNSRLKMLYGDTYGLIFNDSVTTGFEIWIRIPKKIAAR